MTRETVLALTLLLTIPAFASFELDSPAPTDRSVVMLVVRDIWGDGCIPFNAQVTRSGNRVDVWWTVPRGGGCTQAVEHWNGDVPLGLFTAGTYTVHLGVDDILYGPRDLATRTLVVTQAQPAFRVRPNVACTAGGAEIEIENCGPGATLSIDIVVVASRIENWGVRHRHEQRDAGRDRDLTAIGAGITES